MSAVLDRAEVDYLKWDFNRSICDVYSAALPADRQGEVLHRYVLGLYEFLERLGKRYPDMLMEGCSGGGEDVLTQECFIIPLRSGAVMTQMPLNVWISSTELPFVTRSARWELMYPPAQIIRQEDLSL